MVAAEAWLDSHGHLWDLNRGDYDWLDVTNPKLTAIARDFNLNDRQQAMCNTAVMLSILVQAAPTDAETDFLLDIADNSDSIVGVVGWANLESDSVKARLEALSKHPKLLGIRPMLQDIPSTDWIVQPDQLRSLGNLVELNLCFDALITTRHLGVISAVCRVYPELRVMVDHAAKPNLTLPASDRQRKQWVYGMQKLATESNSFCKLSGLLTEMSPKHYKSKDQALSVLQPVFNQLINWFGPERLVWGSDWPVVTLSSTAEFWYELSIELLSELSEEMQRAITHDNALRFYEKRS